MFQPAESSPQRSRNGPRTHQGMPAVMATPHSTPTGRLWVSCWDRNWEQRCCGFTGVSSLWKEGILSHIFHPQLLPFL